MWAIERSRAVAGRFTPSASATSRPCAHVSISRAVAIDAALIGGPNHGSLRPSATASNSSCSRARVPSPVGQQLHRAGFRQLFGALVDETGRIGRRGPQHGGETRLVGDGDQRDAVRPQQVSDLVCDRPARRGCRCGPPLGGQPGHQPIELVAFGPQIGHHRARSSHFGHL